MSLPSASRGAFDFALQLNFVRAKSWREFHAHITGEEPIIEEDALRINTARLEAAGFRTDRGLDEPSLQEALPEVLPIANYVIEDTHATVLNYAARVLDDDGNETYAKDEHGVKCQRCAFARSDGNSLRPDFTVRLPVTGDDKDRIVFAPEIIRCQVPAFRLLPFNTAAVIEIKAQTMNIAQDEIAQQVCSYCDSLLRADFRRRFVFGVVTNLNAARFCAAKYDDDDGRICWFTMESSTRNLDTTFPELVSFLSTDPQSFMPTPTFPPAGVTDVEALGRGSSAVVLQLQFDVIREPIVVKFSRDTTALEAETRILEHLHNHIPRQARNHFPTSMEFTRGYGDWAHEQDKCREIQPRCRIQRMSLATVKKVWDILKHAHGVGVVHCDVRKPNVAVSRRKVVMLDWSSAHYHAADWFVREDLRAAHAESYVELNPRLGKRHVGLITASAAICTLLDSSRDLPDTFDFYPADDAIACIKLGYQDALEYLEVVVKPLATLDLALKRACSKELLAHNKSTTARQIADFNESDARVVAAVANEAQAIAASSRCEHAYELALKECQNACTQLLEYVAGRDLVEDDPQYSELATQIFAAVKQVLAELGQDHLEDAQVDDEFALEFETEAETEAETETEVAAKAEADAPETELASAEAADGEGKLEVAGDIAPPLQEQQARVREAFSPRKLRSVSKLDK